MAKLPFDTAANLIEAGERAARLLGPLAQEVEHREGVILSRLVQSYRNSTLSGKDAMLGVAEIAGLRSLLVDLDSRIRQGQAAEKDLRSTTLS